MRGNFKRIIVPVDGSESSERAADKAMNLGKKLGLPVVAMYVIDMDAFSGIISPDELVTLLKNVLKKEGVGILEKMKKQALEKKVNLQPLLLEGIPDDEIIKEAKKDDLIIMGSKGKSTLDRVFIGSVSEKVLHHSNATVMIIR